MLTIFQLQATDEAYNTPRVLAKCRKRCSTPLEMNRLLQELHRVRETLDLQTHASFCAQIVTHERAKKYFPLCREEEGGPT
jgi:hypothetical protein